MGVLIADLRGGDAKLSCNWWQWRPTIELIRSFEFIERERLDLLGDGIGELAEEEAHQLAALLDLKVLPGLNSNDRVLLDSSVTQIPDDGTFHRQPEDHEKNYGATKEWLTNFSEFCRKSAGIRVS